MKARLSDPAKKEAFYTRRKILRRANPAASMYLEAKKRAKDRGLPFTISPEDIAVPKFCPVFGMLLVVSNGSGSDSSPSLDAIDPSKGYVKGNVQVISNLANRMKNSASKEQLVAFANWVLSESAEGFNGQRAQLKAVA